MVKYIALTADGFLASGPGDTRKDVEQYMPEDGTIVKVTPEEYFAYARLRKAPIHGKVAGVSNGCPGGSRPVSLPLNH